MHSVCNTIVLFEGETFQLCPQLCTQRAADLSPGSVIPIPAYDIHAYLINLTWYCSKLNYLVVMCHRGPYWSQNLVKVMHHKGFYWIDQMVTINSHKLWKNHYKIRRSHVKQQIWIRVYLPKCWIYQTCRGHKALPNSPIWYIITTGSKEQLWSFILSWHTGGAWEGCQSVLHQCCCYLCLGLS